MRWLYLCFLLVSAKTLAQDFRVLDFGSPCAPIAELEEALGSRQVPWSVSGPDLKTFEGRAFGRDVFIIYLCKKGLLFTGNYRFPKENFDDAFETLRKTYETLVSTYGVPTLDTSPWQFGAMLKDPRLISNERKYMTSWLTRPVSTTVALMLDGDEAGANWQVIVVVRAGQE